MHSQEPVVCLVVVTCNSTDVIERCLASVAAQTRLPDRLIVIDNASTDGSSDETERVLAHLPVLAARATVRREAHNLGFAAANNRAIASTDASWVALLNPDAFPESSWLESLLAATRAHPDAAAFGSLQMLDGRPDVVDGCGDVYHVTGLSWRAGHGRPLRPDHLEEREVFSVCAAAALYRRDAVVAVGMFDDDFFCYLEDVDLGFRLRLAGHAAWHVPTAVVRHVGSSSSGGRHSPFAIYHGHRNMVWCFAKNMPQPLFAGLLLPHLAQTIVTFLVMVRRGRARAFLAAKRDALAGLPAILRKRAHARRAGQWRVGWRRIWRVLDAGWWRA